MCGFVGLFSHKTSMRSSKRLEFARDRLEMRGPDDKGIWADDQVALAFRRLAILDLRPSGNQPMHSESEDHVIVFNGEIYNYLELKSKIGGNWRTSTDTEVLLRSYERWGTDCVLHLRGMFSFVIWDRKKKQIFAARDRLGVKPFYYSYQGGDLIFASRPRPIWEYVYEDGKIKYDQQSLRYFLEGGFVPSDSTAFEGIKKLLPGHRMLFSESTGLKVDEYWKMTDFSVNPSLSRSTEEDLVKEFTEKFTESVRLRLISDVPLGAFLSGGLDSSLVVAAMSRLNMGKVKTFSIGFEDKRYDESDYAQAVARHFNTDHHSEILNVDGLVDLIPEMLRTFDEPFFDSSAFPTIAVSKLAKRHVSVVLTGDGGDEFFGGYHYYKIIGKMGEFYTLPNFLNSVARQAVSYLPSHRFQLLEQAMGKNNTSELYAFLRSIQKDFPSPISVEARQTTQSIADYYLAQFHKLQASIPSLNAVEQAMYIDAQNILPNEYLTKVDLATMSQSIEARNPFLDHKLVEWALSLPIEFKIRSGQTKWILRRAALELLPKKIVQGKKKGFVIPIDRWLRTSLKDWAYAILSDHNNYDQFPMDRKVVLELFELHQSQKRNTHPILWAILMFMVFASENQNFERSPQ